VGWIEEERKGFFMHGFERRRRAVVGVLATAAAAIFLLPVSQASAVTIDNACINTANPAAASFIPIDMTATASPNPVAPNGSVTLSNINQTATIPSAIFLAGYRLLGPPFIVVGANSFPVGVRTVISGTNTTQGTQTTNAATGAVATTITDPTPADRNSGDESATPGSLSVTYNNETWTAGASGTINFTEDTVTPLSTAGAGTGGIVINATVGGVINVRFVCSPGEVAEGADPSTIVFTDPGASFAATKIQAPRCAGRRATKFGTNRNDKIRGTSRKDVIAGLGGNDVLRGLAGNDVICGGPGKDRLIGGPGRDRLLGQGGADTLLGGPGLDILRGGTGRDRVVQ
jgi:Ca2+-binding RTX toxin-like protein